MRQTLREHHLIDELNVASIVVIGSGTTLFRAGGMKALRLTAIEQRSMGVVSLSYARG